MKAQEETQEMKWFKENFKLIRQATGWSTVEFAKKTGASQQTISNLETKKDCRLTTILYYAARYALDIEMKERSEKEKEKEEKKLLALVLDAFVDNREKYTDDQRNEIRKKIDFLSPSLKEKKTYRKEIATIILASLGTALAAAAGAALTGFVVGAWIKKIR